MEASRNEAIEADERNVVLGDVHPGGLAQLYSDHPTLLRNLIREPDALGRASNAISGLYDFAEQIKRKHGDVDVHFAVGSASWGGDQPAANIPVLMRRVSISRGEQGEVTLSLLPGVDLNSRLLNALTLARADVNNEQIAQILRSPQGFSPAAALDIIGKAGESLADFELADTLSIGVYTHPTGPFYRELGATKTLSESTVVSALAGHETAKEMLDVALPAPEPADRDPWRELGLGDQDPKTLDAVEVVAGGSSLTVEAGPAVDMTGLAVSFAGALASVGKAVLIVSNEEDQRERLMDAFEEAGVGDIVVRLGDESGDVALNALKKALRETESDLEVELVDALRTDLRRSAEVLSSYADQLHENFPRWGVSAFDALQVLTDLTSLPTPPSTVVRLPEETLSKLSVDSGGEARALLKEAEDLGLFQKEAMMNAWTGVELDDAAEVERAVAAVEELSDERLPQLRQQIHDLATETGLPPATTVEEWRDELAVLRQSQGILDMFTRDVFERSPADMIVATSSKSWRKARNIVLKRRQRRALVRQAKDLVRPGQHLTDLNGALKRAQEARQAWIQATGRTREAPVIPAALTEYEKTLKEFEEELESLKPYLEPVYGVLDTLHFDAIEQTLSNLVAAKDEARSIPDRLRVLDALDDFGLGELANDFQTRGVAGDQIGLELDLSWWASALSYMLAAEPRLGGFEATVLQEHLANFRDLDEKQVELLGEVTVDRVKARRAEAVALYPDQERELALALHDDRNAESLFYDYSIAWDLLPIVVVSPALVPRLVRLGHKVDTVMTIGMEDLAKGLMVPIFARGRSVVALTAEGEAPGDDESSWLSELGATVPTIHLSGRDAATNGVLASVIYKQDPDREIVGVPSPSPGGGVELVVVEGSGTPSPGMLAIESSAGEVDAVLDLLYDSLVKNPDESVGVATFSKRHGKRILSTLQRRALSDPDFAEAIGLAGGGKNLILSPEELMKERPSHVILAVGFTKTPHGRVIHDFGVLSTDGGLDVFEQIARGTPGRLTVVSTLEAAEIDRSRLRQPGALALVDLLEQAHELQGSEGSVAWQVTEQAPDELLVDLADRLHQMGLNVVPNLGGNGSKRIPLAIGHPEVPEQLLVAILTDDQDYLAEPSLRTRDRHTVEMLEEAGWKVRTQLSMAVFIDPNREAEKIVELVLDAVDVHYANQGLPNTPGAAAILAQTSAEVRERREAEALEAEETPETPAESDSESDREGHREADGNARGGEEVGEGGEPNEGEDLRSEDAEKDAATVENAPASGCSEAPTSSQSDSTQPAMKKASGKGGKKKTADASAEDAGANGPAKKAAPKKAAPKKDAPKKDAAKAASDAAAAGEKTPAEDGPAPSKD